MGCDCNIEIWAPFKNFYPTTFWKPWQGEQLHITPAESLEFVVIDFQKETLDIINLKNVTEQVITYKVKTTAPEKYRVRPSTG